jgi:hypothetical protein
MQRAPIRGAGALALTATALAATGCATTQDKSAALRAKATAVDQPGRVRIGPPSPDVRVRARKELRGTAGAAVVVELQNRGPRALVRLPVALRAVAGGKQVYANDGEGGDELLLRAPVVPPRSTVRWVNANLPVLAPGTKLDVVVGSPIRRSKRPAAPLRITGLKRSAEDSGEDGVAVVGTVHNDLRRQQTEVPVYVTVTDRGTVVAAGASRIATIAARSSEPFEAVVVGDGRRGRLAAQALPTTLPKTARSR